jgi:hypothetical protein
MSYSAHRLNDLDTHSELMLHRILRKVPKYTNLTSEELEGAVLQQCAHACYLVPLLLRFTKLFCKFYR